MTESGPLFLTRKFPPSIGGMETLAAGVWRSLSTARPDARLIAMGRSNRNLIWWVPISLLRLAALLARRGTGFVLTGDALMYALARPVLRLFRMPSATMIMGLDVTFENRLYRAVVHRALRRAPLVLSISAATADRAVEIGVPSDRIRVIRLGVDAPVVSPDESVRARAELHDRLGLDAGDVVLLTLGRLVRRKGARWFVAHVLPQLPVHVHYVLAGDGPEAEPVAAAARDAGVSARVHLLGRVDDDLRELLMRGADVFVQPNVRVEGDMEGFGLVTIEAAMRGTLVVAADLEGIKDAVVPDETGLLVPPEDAGAWVAQLAALAADPSDVSIRAREYAAATRERYGEAAMGRQIAAALGIAAR